ncbi:hypothetical protein WA026_013465 [Henosepilachna vigintioctopunctata]|uniref:Dihydrolipoamide acetyltransferase component of pyruvate dehydrogenase complex n=1 Tax=Henosepilachna vigintioctopunctata TaxID=420089 RepID=A0AAW1VG42_9CUCU
MASYARKHVKYAIKHIFKQNEDQLRTLSQDITTFKEWYVKVGDKVSQFDNICEVQSDKASVTITSRYDGIIKKIHYDTEQVAYVGKPLVDIEVEGDGPEETNQRLQVTETQQTSENNLKTESEQDNNDYSLCIPSVRRLARQYKVDLKNITGTGKNSRILKEDVLRYLQQTSQKEEPKSQEETISEKEKVIKITGFQKAMFQTMTASLKIPHFVYTEEIKTTKLSTLRLNLNQSGELNVKLSMVPFFIKALSLGLVEYPILNSSLDVNNENIILKSYHNIGLAMDTKMGLAVPVIKNVENKSILKIAEELKLIMENGKNGNFSIEQLKGGTFTFSNIGVIGGLHASPVILGSQVAIVAIGATKVVPRFDENLTVVSEEVVNMSSAADHRVIDGATMAHFVNTVKNYIENPHLLLIKS